MLDFQEIRDIATIRICSELFKTTNNAPPWNDAWNDTNAFQRLSDIFNTPGFFGLTIMKNQTVLGFIIGNTEIFYNGIHFNLKEMIISFGHQKKGLGCALLTQLEKRLIARNVSEVFLFTSKDNRTNIFYEKSGYSNWDSMTMMGKIIK